MNKRQQRELKKKRRKRFNILRAAGIAILLMAVGSYFHQQLGHLAEFCLKSAEIAAAAVLELLIME